jgi:excisionase family DNA binding protein
MQYITIREAALLLSVHPNSIRNWIKSGELKAERFGNRVIRISLDELKGRHGHRGTRSKDA